MGVRTGTGQDEKQDEGDNALGRCGAELHIGTRVQNEYQIVNGLGLGMPLPLGTGNNGIAPLMGGPRLPGRNVSDEGCLIPFVPAPARNLQKLVQGLKFSSALDPGSSDLGRFRSTPLQQRDARVPTRTAGAQGVGAQPLHHRPLHGSRPVDGLRHNESRSPPGGTSWTLVFRSNRTLLADWDRIAPPLFTDPRRSPALASQPHATPAPYSHGRAAAPSSTRGGFTLRLATPLGAVATEPNHSGQANHGDRGEFFRSPAAARKCARGNLVTRPTRLVRMVSRWGGRSGVRASLRSPSAARC